MILPCGINSCLKLQQYSYEIVNGNVRQAYTNELGLCICIDSLDLANCWAMLSNCAKCCECNPGVIGCMGNLVTEILKCIQLCPDKFILPVNGSCEILCLPHACKIGTQEICIPESALPNWQAVRQQLSRLEQELRLAGTQFTFTQPIAPFSILSTNRTTNHVPVQSMLLVNRAVPFFNAQ